MELALHPAVTLRPGTFAVVVAPPETVLRVLNTSGELQRFLFLYVCGNTSRLLSGIQCRSPSFQVRRSFTVFQLLTILEEAHHTVIFVEHDPGLYEDAGQMPGEVAMALSQAARTALVILYAPEPDPTLDALSQQADRILFLPGIAEPEPRRAAAGRGAVRSPLSASQTTLEGFARDGASRA